jgi:putative transposase
LHGDTSVPDGAPRIRGFEYKGLHRYSLTICAHWHACRFSDRDLVAAVLLQIRHAARSNQFRLLAYCFMPDHVHLVVEGLSDAADLRRFMKAWKQKTGFEYSKRTGGRLWQVGFFDHVLRSDESTERHVDYVLGNPVRAGLARTVGEYPFAGCHLPETDQPSQTDPPPETNQRPETDQRPET